MSIFDSTAPAAEPAVQPSVTDTAVTSEPTTGVADAVATPVITPDAGTPVTEVAGAEPTAKQYLDPSEYGDYLVKIRVDGVDRDVPFSQVRDGIMMQEAFTKRTQELAAERRTLHQANSLQAALDNDPVNTIRQLAQVYDLDINAGLQPVQREPEEQRLLDMQRQLAQQREQIQQQRLNNEITALTQEYGEFDIPSVARFAVENGVDLTTAYKAMSFEQMKQQQTSAQQTEATRQQALAAQVVHAGATTQRGVIAEPPEKINSIHDAWAVARKQLNL